MLFTSFHNIEGIFYEITPDNHDHDEAVIRKYAGQTISYSLFKINYFLELEIMQFLIYFPEGRKTHFISGFEVDDDMNAVSYNEVGRAFYEIEMEFVTAKEFLTILSMLNHHVELA
jgi:hypothetical protein